MSVITAGKGEAEPIMTSDKERTTGRDQPVAYEAVQAEHHARLGERYFRIFSEKDLERHLQALARLSEERPVEVLLDPRRDGTLDCTVLAFDYPGEFSLITGVLAGMGFDILSGDVFTYEGVPRQKPGRPRILEKVRERAEIHKRRRIIDHFSGVFESPLPFDAWSRELRERMVSVILLLERGDESSLLEAKRRVYEMVVQRLALFHREREPVLYPVEVEIDHEGDAFTRLKVVAQDTPAFLYALSNALSVHEVSIEHVRIRTIHGRVEDVVDLVDLQGRRIRDPERLNRIKLSVLLSKQFTYFLEAAPDPYAAFSRFEQLLADLAGQDREGSWREWLQNPKLL